MSLQKSSLCDAAVFLQQNNANVITEVSESALFYLFMVFSILVITITGVDKKIGKSDLLELTDADRIINQKIADAKLPDAVALVGNFRHILLHVSIELQHLAIERHVRRDELLLYRCNITEECQAWQK